MSSKPKAKRPTVGKRKKKQASDYEACARSALKNNEILCLVETKCGARGKALGAALKDVFRARYGEECGPGRVLINPKFVTPRAGSFVVQIGKKVIYKKLGLTRPFSDADLPAVDELKEKARTTLDKCKPFW